MSVVTDNSAQRLSSFSEPAGLGGFGDTTWRGLGSSWFNEANIEQEDFYRDLYSQELAFQRQQESAEAAFDRESAFNAEQAQIYRDWAERLSNTAYTRAVKNLKEAGLNPVLAASQPASTPSASSASASQSVAGSTGGYSASRARDDLATIFVGMAKVIAGLLD